jgi:hypothetical protein
MLGQRYILPVVFDKRGSVKVGLTRTQAFNHAERALTSLHARITRSDLQGGLIEATFPMSWRSWGETFTVRISGGDGDVLLDVSSRPRTLMFGLMDFGKNSDNVRRFAIAPAFDSSVVEAQY